MKIVTVCGILGSGKTTFIREIITRLRSQGRQSAVIVNESGEVDFDEAFTNSNQVRVDRLRGG